MNSFEKTVKQVQDIADGYRSGLVALGADSKYLDIEYPRSVGGSVNVDTCTKDIYPEDNRWDYVISYKGKAFFIEIHPATGGTVKEIEAKLNWLKQWLKHSALALDNYPSGIPRFTWVHSGKCGILKTSKEYKKAAMLGLLPVKILRLS